jgi:hypothetical protein
VSPTLSTPAFARDNSRLGSFELLRQKPWHRGSLQGKTVKGRKGAEAKAVEQRGEMRGKELERKNREIDAAFRARDVSGVEAKGPINRLSEIHDTTLLSEA